MGAVGGRSGVMTNLRKLLVVAPLGTLVVGFIGLHLFLRGALPPVELPEYVEVDVQYLMSQNWNADEWQWFYHASQGGALSLPIPYDWMINLEQPRVPFFFGTPVGRLMDDDYVARFGFLPNPVSSYDPGGVRIGWAEIEGRSTINAADALNNEHALPVGFVRTRGFRDEKIGKTTDMVGLTCAACHTGQLNYRGTGLRINGGPAMTDLGKFRKAVANSIGLVFLSSAVSWMPVLNNRWQRFADAILGPDHEKREATELKSWLRSIAERGKAFAEVEEQLNVYPVTEGVGRLDAVGRIGNFVFGQELDTARASVNYVSANAPVNFPPIWDTPWFEWVQYNGSFMQPLMRNFGEAMGLYSYANFQDLDDDELLFRSTVDLRRLHEMESLIRGPEPYTGLRSPEWPEEILGPIDRERAAAGEDLYLEVCQRCHLPPMTDSAAFFDDRQWTPVDRFGNRYLRLHLRNVDDMGTDPLTALNFIERRVQMGPLGDKFRETLEAAASEAGGEYTGGMMSAGVALPFLIRKTSEKSLVDLGVQDSATIWQFRGYRPDSIQALPVYKARPLNGIWATPPFLHNGSVPNIFLLLGPPDERPDEFWLGTKEYDPVRLGYEIRDVQGGFLHDTAVPGNSNRGHEFVGSRDPESPDYWRGGRAGVIGPSLTVDERMAIVEYLKTLPGSVQPQGGS